MNGPEPATPGDSVFTEAELAYLRTQRLARLATVDPSGHPQNSPVGLHYNPATDTIDVIGWNLAASRKYRNVGSQPHVALVVDDMPVDGSPRGVEIRGRARALPAGHPEAEPENAVIRIHPHRVISWGLDGREEAGGARAFPTGRGVRPHRS